jgi:hypothetical protein
VQTLIKKKAATERRVFTFCVSLCLCPIAITVLLAILHVTLRALLAAELARQEFRMLP